MIKTLRNALITAIVFPIIILQLNGVSTSGWDATLITIWGYLPIFLGIGVLFWFLKMGGIVNDDK